MQNPKGPPLHIQPPPTYVKPDPPPFPSPLPAPAPTTGYIARPLTWNGAIVEIAEIQEFFKKKNIKSESMTVAVIVTIATQQDNLEKSYNLYVHLLSSKTDHGAVATLGADPEKYALEKNLTDQLIEQKTSELRVNLATANIFFGRNPFSKDFKKNAVDFVNILHSNKEPSTDIYNRWLKSITAAYTAKALTEEIKILQKKSTTLAAIHITTNDEKRRDLQARIDSALNHQTLPLVTNRSLAPPLITNRLPPAITPLENRHSLAEILAVNEFPPAESIIEKRNRLAGHSENVRAVPTFDPPSQQRVHIDEINRRPVRGPELHTGRFNREFDITRVNNQLHISGTIAASGPMIITSAGTVAVAEGAALALRTAVQLAIASLTDFLAATASGFFVGVAALVYSPKLANGELAARYTFSTPLSDLALIQNNDLHAIAAINGTIDLPIRLSSKTTTDDQSEIFLVKTGKDIPSKVRVVPANYSAEQNIYAATIGDTSPITLTWTPAVQPESSSTALPVEPSTPSVYPGASVTPLAGRIDPFPEVAEGSFDDYVFVFPIDSGLPPLYVMLRDRREDPGVSWGIGAPVSGVWLDAASKGEGAPIPIQIARQLRGKEFRNFKNFRKTFWKAVASDPILSKQFDEYNLELMKQGLAAVVRKAEGAGKHSKYQLHHKKYISQGGEVYSLDNITVTTPRRHIEIHREYKQ